MILIDLEKCYSCKECKAECNYPYQLHKTGFKKILEEAIRKINCRHCEDAPCVISCPTDALIKKEGDDLNRAGMLCTGCKSCIIACPFGVNTLETVEFFTSNCDLCTERDALCVKTCTEKNALQVGTFEEDLKENIYKVKDGLFVKAIHWKSQIGLKE